MFCLLCGEYSLFFIFFLIVVFFQAEDGIRDLVRSRGLGDVYKRQMHFTAVGPASIYRFVRPIVYQNFPESILPAELRDCLLYTSDAADERSSVDLGGRRIIKKKNISHHQVAHLRNKHIRQNHNSLN